MSAIQQTRTTFLGVVSMVIGVLLTLNGAFLLITAIASNGEVDVRAFLAFLAVLQCSLGGAFLAGWYNSGKFWVCSECGNQLATAHVKLCAACRSVRE